MLAGPHPLARVTRVARAAQPQALETRRAPRVAGSPAAHERSERAERVSHANGGADEAARERACRGGWRGEAPRLSKARPAGLEPTQCSRGPTPARALARWLPPARAAGARPSACPSGRRLTIVAHERANERQRVSHANGARRRSGARESVSGSPRGEAPRLRKARPAGLEPATLGLEGCVPVSEAALLSAGYGDCHADVPRGSLLQGEEEVETLPHSSKLALQTFTVPAGRTTPDRRSH